MNGRHYDHIDAMVYTWGYSKILKQVVFWKRIALFFIGMTAGFIVKLIIDLLP